MPRSRRSIAAVAITALLTLPGATTTVHASRATGDAVARVCYSCTDVDDNGYDWHLDLVSFSGDFFGVGHGYIAGSCADWDLDHAYYNNTTFSTLPPSETLASLTDDELIAFVIETDRAYLNVAREAVQIVGDDGLVLYHEALDSGRIRNLATALRQFDGGKVTAVSALGS